MAYITKNFTSDEFKCPCCGRAEMDPDFMSRLQGFRTDLGIAFSPVYAGGYRCPAFNQSDTGSHTEGKAIDLNINKIHYHKTMKLAFKHGFTGIGVKQKDGKFQLHIDTADEIPGVRPRPWVWTY